MKVPSCYSGGTDMRIQGWRKDRSMVHGRTLGFGGVEQCPYESYESVTIPFDNPWCLALQNLTFPVDIDSENVQEDVSKKSIVKASTRGRKAFHVHSPSTKGRRFFSPQNARVPGFTTTGH